MKKSTWKKLFTRSKSKSASRASKKGGNITIPCSLCAGGNIINVDTLCPIHINYQNRNKAADSAQGPASTAPSVPSPEQPVTTQTQETTAVNEKATEPAAKEDLKVEECGVDKSAPVEIPKPQPLARSSTNEEFMTEEVESHNMSDNSRTEENPDTVLEAEGNKTEPNSLSPNELKEPSGTQELKKASETEAGRVPSGTHGLRIRRSGTQLRDSVSESRGFKVQSKTLLENQLAAESPEAAHELPERPSSQFGLKMVSNTADERAVTNTHVKVEDVADESFDGSAEQNSLNVEAENRKNTLSVADVDLNKEVHGLPAQSRRNSESSGRQVETTSSSNNEEFMSEEVAMGSGASAEGEEAYYPKGSRQVSSAITITKHDKSNSSHHASDVLSNQGLEIVEIDNQEAAQGSRRLSMDAYNFNTSGADKTQGFVKGMSEESSEDLKPGMLQAQRSSKLNISFSEHVSMLGETKGDNQAVSHDSIKPNENTTAEFSVTATAIDPVGIPDGPFSIGAQDLNSSSGTEFEDSMTLPPEDDDPRLGADSGMGSDESSLSGQKETPEAISIQQNTAENPRPTPTMLFGTISGPEQENDWNQPLFFGPNALAQGLTLNVGNREREHVRGSEGQAPFQGFGIISIMRDLYENDSSASQVREAKVTDVTEEKKKEEEAKESGQTPPSLDDEEQDQESFKEVFKKQD